MGRCEVGNDDEAVDVNVFARADGEYEVCPLAFADGTCRGYPELFRLRALALPVAAFAKTYYHHVCALALRLQYHNVDVACGVGHVQRVGEVDACAKRVAAKA